MKFKLNFECGVWVTKQKLDFNIADIGFYWQDIICSCQSEDNDDNDNNGDDNNIYDYALHICIKSG